jgi:hypothetical protein
LSVQVTVQPPSPPTGLTASTSSGSSGTTYNLSWQQVTYPSTAVFYTVNYCDSTATSCASGGSVTWTPETPQLGTAQSLTFPAGHSPSRQAPGTNRYLWIPHDTDVLRNLTATVLAGGQVIRTASAPAILVIQTTAPARNSCGNTGIIVRYNPRTRELYDVPA